MKTGRSLVDLAQELERQKETRKDFLADTRAITMTEDAALSGLNGGTYPVRPHAHTQIASRLKIPKAYYDRMLENDPALLAGNVNAWFQREPETRMVRTLDHDVRGFLSDRYRPLDNLDLADATLPVLNDVGANVESCELTETRLYIKCVLPGLQAEVKGSRQVGDVVQAGIVISNSEVGSGALRVEPMVYRLICLNGMISADRGMRKYHLGRKNEGEGDVEEMLTDTTREKRDDAFWHTIRDVVRGAFNAEHFQGLVDRLSEAASEPLTGDPVKCVEVAADRFALNEGQRSGVLRHLIEGGDLSRWGMVNAITRTGNDQDVYEEATDLERLGGAILELPQASWREIAEAN